MFHKVVVLVKYFVLIFRVFKKYALVCLQYVTHIIRFSVKTLLSASWKFIKHQHVKFLTPVGRPSNLYLSYYQLLFLS